MNALANFDLTPVNFDIASMSVPTGSFSYGDCEFTVAVEIFSAEAAEVQVTGITMHQLLEDYSDDDRFVAALAHHVGTILRVDGVKLMHNENIAESDQLLFDFA